MYAGDEVSRAAVFSKLPYLCLVKLLQDGESHA